MNDFIGHSDIQGTMGEPLRIAQFTTNYPYPDQFSDTSSSNLDNYFCSGAERVVVQLSEELSEQGHDVTVFTSSATSSFEKQEQNGVTVIRSPSFSRVGTTMVAPTLLVDHLKYDFDIVHAHNSTPPGVIAGCIHSKLKDVPLVITHHGGEQYQNQGSFLRRAGLFSYNRILLNQIFRVADQVVIPSPGYADESDFLDLSDDNVVSIPNGVSLGDYSNEQSTSEAKEEIGIDTDQFCILYLGSHYPRKGVDVLLDAFSNFHSEYDKSTLVLAGEGELTPSLRDKVANLGLEDDVHFPGFLLESEKPTYLLAADVFCLPSVPPSTEMFPLVILEAAAAGTPIIASEFPTIRGVVESYDTALLVEPGDRERLAEALEELYSNEDRLIEMEAGTNQMAEDHSWREVESQYEKLFRRSIINYK